MDNSALFSMRLSLQVATVATVLIVIVGVGVAYFLAQRDFRGKELMDIAFTLPLVLEETDWSANAFTNGPVGPSCSPGTPPCLPHLLWHCRL